MVYGLWFMVYDFQFMVYSYGLWFKVYGLWCGQQEVRNCGAGSGFECLR